MKKVVILGVAAALLLMVSAAVQPANASCPNSRGFVSGYIYTPGVCVDGGGDGPCDVNGTSVSPAFSATFWHVGNGNPTEGLGNDSDGFVAIPNWVIPYPNYPVGIVGNWSSSAAIDGCIDTPAPGGPADKCMAVQMFDVDPDGNPMFLIITDGANASGTYDFGGPFTLAPLPALNIVNSVRTGGGTGVQLQAVLDAAGLQGGVVLSADAACAAVSAGAETLIDGYRLRYRTVPRGGAVPNDPLAGGWTDCGGGPVALGQPGTCNVPTPGDVDVFLSYSLLVDSGYESGVTGDESSRVQGGPNVAVPEPRIQIRQGGKTSVRTR